MKQLIINGKKSYDDFDLYISDRKISQPKKKSIKESVPFSNTVYDFSKINGEIYWEERTLEYIFDIAEISTEKMEEVKSKVLNWLLNVHDTDIYDPYIGDYHFHGSFNSDSWDEDFGAGTLTISFSVYPYKISNNDKNVIEEIDYKNLYNFNDLKEKSDEVNVDKEGWITISYDNSGGSSTKFLNYYTNNLNLETSKDYIIVVEIKNVSGSGILYPFSQHANAGQFISSANLNFANLSTGLIRICNGTTISDFSQSEYGLRTFVGFDAGQSGRITFRLSVLEDTNLSADDFVYGSFDKGSSELIINNNSSHRIMPKIISKGNFTIEIVENVGKNLLDTSVVKDVHNQFGIERKGYYYKIPQTGNYSLYFNVSKNLYWGVADSCYGTPIQITDSSTNRVYKFNKGEYLIIWGADETDTNLEIMVTFSDTVDTNYEPYQGKKIVYSIGEGTYTDTFYLESGENELTLSGYGEITFSYAEEMF